MKINKILLVGAIGFCALSSCNKGGGGGGGGNIPDPVNPVVDPTKHTVEGTLHDININNDNTRPFIVNGSTEYALYAVDNYKALEAASFIKTHLIAATNVDIVINTITEDAIIEPNKKAIVIGSDASFTAAGLAFTDKDLSVSGYQMVSKDNAVYIHVKNEIGYQMAAYKFLEVVIGYDCLYNDTFIYEKDGSVLPEMNIVEKPDFDFRKDDDPNTTWRYGAGFSNNNVFMNIGGICYHTSLKFLPPDDPSKEDPSQINYEYHKKWYSNRGDKTQLLGQLCYTCHGDNEEYEKALELATEKAMEAINASPTMNNLTFTINDNYNMCNCPDCEALANQYGGSKAAGCLLFANKLDDRIQAKLQEQAEETHTPKREIYLSIFAYHETENAPCYKDEQGHWHGYNDIKCNEHVAIFLAPISSHFTKSFYETNDPQNAATKDKVESWGSITKHLYCWVYECNFKNYMYPFNSYEAMVESYRHLKTNNCSLVYPQDEHDNYGRSCFSRLKQYINSKVLNNVNLDVGPIIDKFFKYYYDEGGTIMRQFYDEMVTWMKYLEKAYPDECQGSIYESVNNAKYWNENMLRKWNNYCNDALTKIEYLKSKDANKYERMRKHIINESLFPRWALLELYQSSFTDTQLYNERVSFKNDGVMMNVSRYAENRDMTDVYAGWGL